MEAQSSNDNATTSQAMDVRSWFKRLKLQLEVRKQS